jgi:hypothetical protein
MRAGWLVLALVAAGAPSVFAHSGQFLLAKVLVREPGRVQLEVTVDYGANPMVQTEEEASEALLGVLRVIQEGRSVSPEELGPVRMEKRADLDPTCPLPDSPGPATAEPETHQLLTAVWTWTTRARSLAFEVPKGVPHDVILWRVDGDSQQRAQSWFYLIAGDHTAPLSLSQPSLSFSGAALWGARGCALVLLGAIGVVGWRKMLPVRRRP